MNPIYVNVYYILDGVSHSSMNHYLSQGMVLAKDVILAGGEITGIINSEEDK